MADSLDRRSLLRSLGTLALAASGPAEVFAQKALAGTAMRKFTWQDAFNRAEVERAEMSPKGDRVAIQIARPLSAGGNFGGNSRDWLDPRGEIWLVDGNLGQPVRLDSGRFGASAPAFSPDGSKLAALTCDENGVIGLMVWDIASGQQFQFAHLSIDVYAKLALAGDTEVYGNSTHPGWRQFVWTDSDTIICVDRGSEPVQFDLGVLNASATLPPRWKKSAAGEASVRVWGDSGQTCGLGRSLVRLSCHAKASEVLYRGDVRGVSVAPDGTRAALLVATSQIAPSPDALMPLPLRFNGLGDDPLVAQKLTIVDMKDPQNARDVAGVVTVGSVSPARLPLWSDNSAFLSLAAREVYSGAPVASDVCWTVKCESLSARRAEARSALDAELLAALSAAFPSRLSAGFPDRPGIPPVDGLISGRAWKVGAGCVLLWNENCVTIMRDDKARQVAGEFTSLQMPVSVGDAVRSLAVQKVGGAAILTMHIARDDTEALAVPPNWSCLAWRPADGAAVFKEDAETGTSLYLASPVHATIRSPLARNAHLAGITKPSCRALSLKTADGETFSGTLQLPVACAPNDRHPVIIWAYPDQPAVLNGSLTRLNSNNAVAFPFQYLLTRGFAFFHAPFPTTGKHHAEPMRMAVDAIEPWLDVLGRQPEIIPGEFGFFGHSNAGYAALALEVLSKRFKAIVACSTFPDLGFGLFYTNGVTVAADCAGNITQGYRFPYEDPVGPYFMDGTAWKEQDKYLRNAPLFHLDSASTPLLLIEGEFDAAPRAMEATYSILRGRGVPVELAYYWGESHIFSSPGNILDTWTRSEAFFGRYLKRH